MGANWRLLVSLLVPFALFAQWDDSDRAILSTINVRLSNLNSIANALNANVSGSLASDVVTIRDRLNNIQGNSFDIRDSLYGIQSYVHFHYNRDNLLVQDSNLYAKADEAVDQLGTLNAKFDTFLEYYSNNLQKSSFSPWVYTNLAYGIDFFMDYNPELDLSTAAGNDLLWIYRVITGNYNASIHEAEIFWQYYNDIQPPKWHLFDLLARIDYKSLSPELADENGDLYDILFPRIGGLRRTLANSVDSLGAQYNYLYGTKDIKLAVNAISNAIASPVVDRYNSVVLDPKETFETSENKTRFSSLVSGVVHNLSDSALSLSMVDTNDLPRPDTNAINQIANDGIKGVMDTAQSNGTRLGDELIGSIRSSIGSFDTVVSDSLQVPSGAPKLTLGYITMDSTYKTYDIEFPDRSAYLSQVFQWAIGVLDFVISVVGAWTIYNRALDQIRPPVGR